MAGNSYQLPSEAQWEYACRAGTTTAFSFGETISPDQANYDGNYPYGYGREGKFRQETTPVGQFPANALGLFDMHGNVSELCKGRTDLATLEWFLKGGPKVGSYHVLRGGSFFGGPWLCRSATRLPYTTGWSRSATGCCRF